MIRVRRGFVGPERRDQLAASDRSPAIVHEHREHQRPLTSRQPPLDPLTV
jgi:hypothetical protein